MPAKRTDLRAILSPPPLWTINLKTGMCHARRDDISPSTYKIHVKQSGNWSAMSAQMRVMTYMYEFFYFQSRIGRNGVEESAGVKAIAASVAVVLLPDYPARGGSGGCSREALL